MLNHVVNRIFYSQEEAVTQGKALSHLFNVPFLELSISMTLTELIESFEYLSEQMEEKTKRSAWSKFLDRTVFHYI